MPHRRAPQLCQVETRSATRSPRRRSTRSRRCHRRREERSASAAAQRTGEVLRPAAGQHPRQDHRSRRRRLPARTEAQHRGRCEPSPSSLTVPGRRRRLTDVLLLPTFRGITRKWGDFCGVLSARSRAGFHNSGCDRTGAISLGAYCGVAWRLQSSPSFRFRRLESSTVSSSDCPTLIPIGRALPFSG